MVYKKKYDWSTFKGLTVSADTVGETLERIERENGGVSRKAFLDASRPKDSPTHALFEWDNKIAAERYRLQQSGRYIRDLKVTVILQEETPVNVTLKSEPWEGPAYINAGERRQSGVQYSNVFDAMKDEVKRANMLSNAKAELMIFQRKYKTLDELSGVFREIEKVAEAS